MQAVDESGQFTGNAGSALGACPDCGGKVSVHAAACPHCGRPGELKWAAAVSVKNVDMEFGTMVGFLVKLAFAAIPAAAVVFAISAVFVGVFTGALHR